MLGAFVQASIARRRTLESSLADIDRDMAAVRADINTAFRELKKYELIEERRAAAAKKARRKRDRRDEDELGMSMHRRAKQAAGDRTTETRRRREAEFRGAVGPPPCLRGGS
jgi:hypothetical protein